MTPMHHSLESMHPTTCAASAEVKGHAMAEKCLDAGVLRSRTLFSVQRSGAAKRLIPTPILALRFQ